MFCARQNVGHHLKSKETHRRSFLDGRAYRALSERKGPGESFTEVILRLASERVEASKLLALIRSMEADEELVMNVEEAIAWRRTLKLRETTV